MIPDINQPLIHRQGLLLSQQAYDLIKRKIVSLELAPGAIIDEGQLQAELNLGRTPIREALLRLSLEKLVTIVPRRGIFVSTIGISDLQQIFEVRTTLEKLAARLAAQRGTPTDWEQMERLLNELGEPDLHDSASISAFDEACHLLLYRAAGNELLRDILTTLYSLSQRLWCYLSITEVAPQTWLEDHRTLLQALRQGNADLAGDIIEAHIRTFQESIQAVLLA